MGRALPPRDRGLLNRKRAQLSGVRTGSEEAPTTKRAALSFKQGLTLRHTLGPSTLSDTIEPHGRSSHGRAAAEGGSRCD
eukprot:4277869-Prymnesium_polylepis.1